MKKLLLIPMAALVFCGCNTTSFEATKPDGTHLKIANHRLFWSSDSYTATISTNGASLSANKSTSDSAAIQAIVQGAVAGATQAIKP